MIKAEQRIKSEDIRNAFIFTKWNDIYNVDMNKLAAILASGEGFKVDITQGLTVDTSSVNASGAVQHVITDAEVVSFGITDKILKKAIKRYFVQPNNPREPNDAYLRSPTPWGDLYTTYNWAQVQTILVVDSATITKITSEPEIVKTQKFVNKGPVKGTFNVGIMDQVANTSSSTWSKTHTITAGQKVTYKIIWTGEGEIGGETSFSYSFAWGEGGSQTKAVTIGSQAGVSVVLEPGQGVEVQLSASRGVMKVRIVYKAYLIGYSAVNYNPTYPGPYPDSHHFWALDIGEVMAADGITNLQTFTEDIEVGFYSNSKIELKDLTGGQLRTLWSAAAHPIG